MPLFTEVGAKVSNTSVNSGAEPLKSRWDYRSRCESGEYFGKFRGKVIEIKNGLPWITEVETKVTNTSVNSGAES